MNTKTSSILDRLVWNPTPDNAPAGLTNIYHVTYSPEVKEIVLFFWGCNLDCRGCYRRKNIHSLMLEEYINVPNEEPTGLAEQPQKFLSFEEVMDLFEGRDVHSVVMEGAEPALDPLFLKIVRALHERFGTHNILLTNALELPEDLTHIDAVEVSFKAIDEDLHYHYTGKSNRQILANFRNLHDSGMKLIVESVFIPAYVDLEETERIAEFVASVDPGIPYFILPYIRTSGNPWRRPTAEEMEEAAAVIRKHLTNVRCIHGDEKPIFKTIRLV